jgi:hypothetical protein
VAKEIAMSVLSLQQPYRHIADTPAVTSNLRRWRLAIVACALGFPIVFYLALLCVLVVQYGHLPNYFTVYDWIGNVLRIIHGTRSITDIVLIVANEWLLEVGYMDYGYGHGVAAWSLAIIPHKLLIMSLAGALIGLNVALLFDRQAKWSVSQQCVQACRSGFLTSLGGFCAGLTSMTVFSVACCAAPSWAGSLTVLGVETSLAFALEPFGPIASLFGLAALAVSALWMLYDIQAKRPDRATPDQLAGGRVRC